MSAPTGNFRGQRTQSSSNGYKTIGSSIASGSNGGCFKRIFINALGNTNGNYDLAFTKTLGIPRNYYNSTSNNSNYQQPSLSGKRLPVITVPTAISLTQVSQTATVLGSSINCALDNNTYSSISTTSNSNVYQLNSNFTLSCQINNVPTGKFLYIPPNVTMTIPTNTVLLFSTSSTGQYPGYISNNGTINGSGTFSVSYYELYNQGNTTTGYNQNGYTFNLSVYLSSLSTNYQYITIILDVQVQLENTTVIPANVTLVLCGSNNTTGYLVLTEQTTNNGSIQIGCESCSGPGYCGELSLGNNTLINNNLIYLYNSGYIDGSNISGPGLFLNSSP
jgi:hypothetical protein